MIQQILASIYGLWFLCGQFFVSKFSSENVGLQDDSINTQCLDPPFIYVSTHHEVGNLLKYTRDGCLLMDDVLIGGVTENELIEFRTMVFGDYKGSTSLFIADSTSGNSSVLIYDGVCDDSGRRKYLDTVVATTAENGADHCYGLTFDDHGNVYVSFQHTDNVLRFHKNTHTPMKLPYALRHANPNNLTRPYFPGTFVQFGQPMLHDITEQGVRAIEFINGRLWVCNEDLNGIVIVDGHTGLTLNIINVIKPIDMHYRPDLGVVFVGSKQKHWRGSVVAIDVYTMTSVANYTNGRINHPSGITSFGDDLFVGEVAASQILRFSISTTEFLGIIVDYPPGEIESLLISSC